MSVQAFDVGDDRRLPATDVSQIVERGLRAKPKRLPSWLFYDDVGSALFEQICDQPEYYLTRAEISLLGDHAGDIASAIGPDARLVEYGSGHAQKTSLLLAHLENPVAWVPVEISAEPLRVSVQNMTERFADLAVQPLCADFTRPFRLPIPPRAPRRTVLYFPGSTIGNFEAREAVTLLRKMRNEMGDNGAVLIGVDLKKDREVIEAAYNDKAGVTSAFTLNMLARLNREWESDFDLAEFSHRARYNAMIGRIETDIVSRKDQYVLVGRHRFHFKAEEAMHVEYSCKYSLDDFAALAARAGLEVRHVWLDAEGLFSVQYLVRAGGATV